MAAEAEALFAAVTGHWVSSMVAGLHTSMVVLLRTTAERDLDAVAEAEADEDTRRWIGDTSIRWHRTALEDADQEHLVVLVGGEFAGFVVLAGLSNPHRSVELRRILVTAEYRGQGVGRQAFRAAVDRAFDHGAHRVWLDVKETNHRARAVYVSEGFSEEGLLREEMQEQDGSWSSVVVMSQLETERRST